MKAVVDIEYIMAVFVFLASITFITLSISREFLAIREASFSETVKMESFTILELLLFDKGEPEDWHTAPLSNVKRLGLSSGRKFVLDETKLIKLDSDCDVSNPEYELNYAKIKELLGIEADIVLNIQSLDGSEVWDCSPAVESLLRPKFYSHGYGVIQGSNKIVSLVSALVI
jgi:hypothetical protein